MAASSSSSIEPLAKRTRRDNNLLRDIISSSETKTSVVDTLDALNNAGMLSEVVTRRDLQHASEHHANQQTPYGNVVQRLELNAPGLNFLNVCHPFAFLWYLSSISTAFAELMSSACEQAGGYGLRLVIYVDEMCPGNPFRPEKSRTLQCVYWAFVDWPAHVLSRTFAWPCLCLIRSCVVDQIPGGMSYICRMLLRLFFPEGDGHSLARGVMLPFGDRSCLCHGRFAGFLCDLKGHKENTAWKGYNGNVCCLTCGNVDLRVRGKHGRIIGIDHPNPADFIKRSNEDVFNTVDELAASRQLIHTKRAFEQRETDLGFNYCPNGLLFDVLLRSIFKPVDHTLRDWMHVMCSDGVANSCCGEVLQALKQKGYALHFIRQFMVKCKLPSKYGKANAEWLRDSRLKTHTVTSFSGIMLTIVPIIFLFFCEFCDADDTVKDLMELIKMLHFILGVMASGPEIPMEFVDDLRTLLTNFHTAYCLQFNKVKPKLHHMHHIIDHMLWLGKLLACFVTERKHRMVKESALHVFRYMEHTVLVDIVNKHCEQITSGFDLFKHTFLVQPQACKMQPDIKRSSTAVLPCGRAAKNDVCFFSDMTCGRILAFFFISGQHFVEVALLGIVGNDPSLRTHESTATRFVECRFLVDTCIWHFTSRTGIIRVCVPPILLLRR